MKRRRLLVAALGATTLAIGACGAILDIDPDAFVTAKVDASVTSDASADASDASDASDDVAADAASHRPSPCPGLTDVTLCDDFDTDRDAGWSTQIVSPNGSLQVSDAASSSEPQSLLAETERGSSGDALALLVKAIEKATSLTIEFDVRPCDVAAGAAAFVVISDSKSIDTISMGFGRDGTGMKAAVVGVTLGGVKASPYTAPFDFHTKQFVHVRWTTVFAEGSSGSTKLEVADQPLLERRDIPTSSPNIATRVIQIGVYTPGPACSAYIDNVVIDAH